MAKINLDWIFDFENTLGLSDEFHTLLDTSASGAEIREVVEQRSGITAFEAHHKELVASIVALLPILEAGMEQSNTFDMKIVRLRAALGAAGLTPEELPRRMTTAVDHQTFVGFLLRAGLASLCRESHAAARAAGWYVDPHTGARTSRNIGEMLMLAVSGFGCAMDGFRNNLSDDHLPHRPMVEVGLADVLISVGDLAGYLGLDLGGAVVEKMAYNAQKKESTWPKTNE